MTEDPELLTVREVASRLRLNPETVRRMIRAKRLVAVPLWSDRAGYRVLASELRRFIAEGPVAPET